MPAMGDDVGVQPHPSTPAAAAEGILSIAGHLDQFQTGNRLQQRPGRIVTAATPPHAAVVVIGDRRLGGAWPTEAAVAPTVRPETSCSAPPDTMRRTGDSSPRVLETRAGPARSACRTAARRAVCCSAPPSLEQTLLAKHTVAFANRLLFRRAHPSSTFSRVRIRAMARVTRRLRG